MRVNVISESEFTVQGHGVHSAFKDTVDALKKYTDYDVAVNTSRKADVTHIHSPGPYALKKLLFDKGAKVVSAHVTPASFVGSLAMAKYWQWLARAYLAWFYNRADAVLAVSSEVVDELRAMGVRKPVYLVPNTIATETFRSTAEERHRDRRELGINNGEFVVMGCGQVQPRKRVDVFVEAARALPELRFVWVGGMPFKGIAADRGAMEQVMSNHPANVTFTGLIDRVAVERWYRAADLFFLPSMQETFGLVILEAAAAGLPLLLRDLEQYRQTFTGGYEHGNDDNFTTKIKEFSTNKQYYDHWQRAAKRIAERYDSKAGAERLVEVYEKTLAQHLAQTTEARS
jgi:1,2-diacylglycerol-3-alpha-glucose alpha-1,2-galactosyltransferase